VAEIFKTAYEIAATIKKATTAFHVKDSYFFNSNIFSEEEFLPSQVIANLFRNNKVE